MRKVTMRRPRVPRYITIAVAAVVTAGLGGAAALAATANTSSTVINGCYNATTGALRVLTPKSSTCGSEKKISWSQTGPAGNGYDFTSTAGTLDKLGFGEADGPVMTKKGEYLVNLRAQEDISAYTSGLSGTCALALGIGKKSLFVYESLPTLDLPIPAADIGNSLPINTTVIIDVPSSEVGYQFYFTCEATTSSGEVDLTTTSANWLVSPVATSAGAASTEPFVSHGSRLFG